MSLIPIENNKNLLRDSFTGAVINTNKTEYDAYISNYNRLKKEKDELTTLKNDVSNLSSSVDEIKKLLSLLIEEKKNDS